MLEILFCFLFKNICKYSDVRQLKVISCFELYISECCHCSDYFVLIRTYFRVNKCEIIVLKDEKTCGTLMFNKNYIPCIISYR